MCIRDSNNLDSAVNEGGSDFIEISELSFSDLQPLGDINFNVTTATSNGFLAFLNDPTTQITSFTQADIDNRDLIYIHDGSETVNDSFTFTVDDGQGNSQAGQIFNITVVPQNDAPVNTVPGNQVTDEDTPLVFNAANGNQITIADADAGNSLIEVTVSAANGTITLGSTTGVSISNGTGAGDSTVTFVATQAIANGALDGLTFNPTENFNGSANITIMTNDLGNSGAGGAMQDMETINITLNAMNDAPVAMDDTFVTDEDTPLNVVTQSILDNDDDVDDALVITQLSGTSNGTLTLNPDGTFEYVPDANFFGTDSFTYQLEDPGGATSAVATVTITVNPVNDSPTDTSPDSVVVPENTDTTSGLVVATLVTSDVDAGETFTYSIVGGPDAAIFSINGDELILSDGLLDHETRDQYSVVIRATDSGGLTHDESITVAVEDVNEAPVVNNQSAIVDEGQSIIFDSSLLSVSDPEQSPNALTYSIETLPVNGELFLDGNLLAVGATFTQADVDSGRVRYDHNGTNTVSDIFMFNVTDGQLQTTSETFSLVINPVNDVPIANDDSFTAIEDTPRNLQVLSNDVDDDGDSLSVSISSSPNRGGTVSVNADGSFDYQPAANFFGTETFEYQVDDGNGGISTATVTVNVLSQNDAPVVGDDFYQVLPGQPLIPLESVLQNDFDIEGSALTAVLLSPPANGSLSFLNNGQFVYASTPGFVGTDSFTYLASDGTETSVARVEICLLYTSPSPRDS